MLNRKSVLFFFLLTAYLVLSTSASQAQPFTYVGTKSCKMCHNTEAKGKVYDFWNGTKHAMAFKALQ